MLYAVKVGPLETAEGRITAYCGFSESGMAPPVFADGDAEGLRGLRDAAGDVELRCEKRLERAGRPLGFVAGPTPPWAVEGRASLSLAMALGPSIDMRDAGRLMTLAHACGEFWRSRAWAVWHDGQPIAVTVSGPRTRRYEGSIMGNAGQLYGLALYDNPGAVRRIVDHLDAGRMDLARQEDCIAVHLDDGPRFAVEALKLACGLPRLPRPLRLRRGRVERAEGPQLTALAGAARAIAAMAPDQAVEGSVGVDDIVVTLQAPPPEG